MENADDGRPRLSRRELLKRVTVAGAAAAVPIRLVAPAGAASEALLRGASALQGGSAVTPREALETLTAAEAETLEAIVARLVPTDAGGPGAAEARAAHYIDRALGGTLASSLEAYRSGLAALDRYARTSKGQTFAQLSPPEQDAVLGDMERSDASGFTPNSAAFFNLLLAHTIQGTFCDPYYGGNVNFVGWDLIGYPGVRLAVAPDEQRLDARPTPTHRSAYDHAMFSKRRPARARLSPGDHGHAG